METIVGHQRVRRIRVVIFRATMADGGADRVTVTLLRHLDLTRFDPTLLLLRREGVLLDDVPPHVPIHELGARRLGTAWIALARFLRRTRPDVLLSTSSGANVVASLAHLLSRMRGRLVLSERNVVSPRKRLLHWGPIARVTALLYRRADAIIAVSGGVANDLSRSLRLPRDRVRVIWNPISHQVIERLANEPISHPWVNGGPPLVLAVGRMVEAKDYPVLLRAMARLRRGRAVRLMVLGEGPLRGSLVQLRSALGLEEDVAFPGYIRNPFAYMRRCAVYVLSSQYEGMPNALLEAMACGAAVVSTDCSSGPAEIIEQGESGVLVPVGDDEKMAEAIESLLADPDSRQRLGERARQRTELFRAEVMVREYERVLAGPRPTAGAGGVAA